MNNTTDVEFKFKLLKNSNNKFVKIFINLILIGVENGIIS